jgi:hypothetical protein
VGTGEKGISTRRTQVPPLLTLVVVSSSLCLHGGEEAPEPTFQLPIAQMKVPREQSCPRLLPLLLTPLALSSPMFAQERTPLEEFVDGFPIELESLTRKASYEELFRGGDISAYFNVRTSEFMDTAVLPARQPQMLLGSCTPSYPGRCAVTERRS